MKHSIHLYCEHFTNGRRCIARGTTMDARTHAMSSFTRKSHRNLHQSIDVSLSIWLRFALSLSLSLPLLNAGSAACIRVQTFSGYHCVGRVWIICKTEFILTHTWRVQTIKSNRKNYASKLESLPVELPLCCLLWTGLRSPLRHACRRVWSLGCRLPVASWPCLSHCGWLRPYHGFVPFTMRSIINYIHLNNKIGLTVFQRVFAYFHKSRTSPHIDPLRTLSCHASKLCVWYPLADATISSIFRMP